MDNDKVGIVARSGGRRLQWLAVAVAAPLFGVVAAFATVQDGLEPVPFGFVVEPLAPAATPLREPGTIIYFQEDRFRDKDTLPALLERLGAGEGEAATFRRSTQAVRYFRHVRPGMTVQAKVDEGVKLRSLWFLTDRDTILSIDRLGAGCGASRFAVVCETL